MPQYRVVLSTVVTAESREHADTIVQSIQVPENVEDLEVDSIETVNEIGKF